MVVLIIYQEIILVSQERNLGNDQGSITPIPITTHVKVQKAYFAFEGGGSYSKPDKHSINETKNRVNT